MAMFYFPPNEEVVISSNKDPVPRVFVPLTYAYNGMADLWYIRDPKSGNWITYMAEGVPEIYRAQVLLLVAAYPD